MIPLASDRAIPLPWNPDGSRKARVAVVRGIAQASSWRGKMRSVRPDLNPPHRKNPREP